MATRAVPTPNLDLARARVGTGFQAITFRGPQEALPADTEFYQNGLELQCKVRALAPEGCEEGFSIGMLSSRIWEVGIAPVQSP